MFGIRGAVDPQLALEQITHQTDAISQISTSGVGAVELLQAYLRWTESARRGLRGVFEVPTVAALIETPHYWFLRGADAHSVRVIPAVVDELDERSRSLATLREQIETERAHWHHDNEYLVVVPDTSMAMSQAINFADYDWCEITGSQHWLRIVVTLRLLVELDGLKDRGSDGQKRIARGMIKWLNERLADDPRDPNKLMLANTRAHTTVEVFAAADGGGSDADMTFIDAAEQIGQFCGRPTTVVSRDLNQTVRSRIAGQPSTFIPTA